MYNIAKNYKVFGNDAYCKLKLTNKADKIYSNSDFTIREYENEWEIRLGNTIYYTTSIMKEVSEFLEGFY